LLTQLVDDGKAYAQAELKVGKAVAAEKLDGLKLPALLGLAALMFLQAGIVLLGMTVYLTLVSRVGPFGAGLIATMLFVAIAGGLGWYAAKRARDLL
jgi:type IV secretory pathway VirB6-like protein